MTPKARADAVESFTDALDDKGNRKQKHNYQFLVGTTKFLNTGLQLTRACNVVLMEPDFIFANEIQSYARVYRIGQKNPESKSYRLIDDGSAIERAIIERQVNRQEYLGRLDNSGEL